MEIHDPSGEMDNEKHLSPTPRELLQNFQNEQDELLASIVQHMYNFLESNLAQRSPILESLLWQIDKHFLTPRGDDTNDLEILDAPESAAAHNPFQFSNPSQPASTSFPNVGGPTQSLFSFSQPSSTAQPPQTSPSPFSFGLANGATSTNLQQNTPFASAFGQPSNAAHTDSGSTQQNTTFASAFGQPSNAAQTQSAATPDLMMISPEKKPGVSLGKSIFDRVEKASTDASSSPATTTTAPPPIFSFNQNAFATTGSQQASQSPAATNHTAQPIFSFAQKTPSSTDSQQNFQSPAATNSTIPAPMFSFAQKASTTDGQQDSQSASSMASNADNPFTQNTTSSAPSVGQIPDEEAAPSYSALRPSSAGKAGRTIAEPKRHVEDKPVHDNPFNNILSPKDQPSAVSSTNSSHLAPTKEAKAVTSQASGGIFGNLAKQGGPTTENPYPSFNKTSNAQGSSNVFGGLFSKPSTEVATVSPSKGQPLKQGSSSFVKSPDTIKDNGSPAQEASSKTTNASAPTHDETGRRYGEPPEPPESWTAEEKAQFVLVWNLKKIDVGANGVLKAIVAAKETWKIKHLKRFYLKKENEIWAEYHESLKRAGITEPQVTRTRKRSYDQQNDDALPSTGLAPGSQSAQQETNEQQENGSDRHGKRARLTEVQQVSYPSLSNAAPNSNTSSMFKKILDKPAVITNGESSTQPPSLFSKPSKTNSSVLDKSRKDSSSELAPNPFADSIAKWKTGTSSSPPKDVSTAETPAVAPSPISTFKPVTATTTPATTSDIGALKMPKFAQTTSTDFFKQFGQSSRDRAKEEMEKRKAEDMDSDEDEAEWERRDAEEQRAKKKKLEQETSKLKPKFIPGQGFSFETSPEDGTKSSPAEDVPATAHVNELDRQHAEHVEQQAASAKSFNIFAQLAKQDSGNEGSKSGDADDEEDGSDDEDKQTTSVKKPTGGSLFDRISTPTPQSNKDANSNHPLAASSSGINIFGNISGAAASVPKFNPTNKPAAPAPANIFGKLPSSTPSQNVFGTPTSANAVKAFGSAETGDNTWKPESPIKFGSPAEASNKKRTREEEEDTDDGQGAAKRADTKDAPAVNVTSPSPSKAPAKSSLFGTNPGVFAQTPNSATAKTNVPPSAGVFGQSFGFGISPLKPGPTIGSLFPPSATSSNGVSRSNSPGATTGESAAESNADGEEEEAEKHEQLNLTAGGPGEEGEEKLYEVRAKASIWLEDKEDEDGKKVGGWETRGLGPFRILKNTTTRKTRMLMRSDPVGRIILNSSLVKDFKYDAPTKSTCRLPMLSATQKLENWVIKVGKDADAGKMAEILEANKEDE